MRSAPFSLLRKVVCTVILAAALSGCHALGDAIEPVDFGAMLGRDHRIEVRSLPIALQALDPTVERVGRLEYRGGLYLNSSDRRFGALSGLIVSADGTQMLAVSEGGYWFTADLDSKDGRLSGLAHARLAPMLDGEGKPLARRAAVAKAVTPVGSCGLQDSLYVSFERNNRILLYPFGKDGFDARPKFVDMPEDAPRLTASGGIQGLVMAGPGTLFAQSEDARDKMNDLQAWSIPVAGAGKRGIMFLKARGTFKPTDLAALPGGGDVFLLERSFSLSEGASMQIRRLSRGQIQPLAVLDGEILAKLDVRYSIDNMEGLAVRRGPSGEILLYVLSNDHYSGLQRTVLLEFALSAEAANPKRRTGYPVGSR
jgi:hypothetical protein